MAKFLSKRNNNHHRLAELPSLRLMITRDDYMMELEASGRDERAAMFEMDYLISRQRYLLRKRKGKPGGIG